MQPLKLSERTLLFLHVPKSGGATLNRILHLNCRDDNCASIDAERFHGGVYWFPGSGFLKPRSLDVEDNVRRMLRRTDLRAVLGHYWYGIHQYVHRPWIYGTMLRHPIDRVLSLYRHLKRAGRLPDAMTADEFVLNPPFREVDNDQTRRISGMEPEIGGCSEAMLRKAQDNLMKDFAVVGVTDKFEETVVLLKRKFGWMQNLVQPRYNVSRSNSGTEALDTSLRQMILARNELDLQLYEYAAAWLADAVSAEDPKFFEEVGELRDRNRQLSPITYID